MFLSRRGFLKLSIAENHLPGGLYFAQKQRDDMLSTIDPRMKSIPNPLPGCAEAHLTFVEVVGIGPLKPLKRFKRSPFSHITLLKQGVNERNARARLRWHASDTDC